MSCCVRRLWAPGSQGHATARHTAVVLALVLGAAPSYGQGADGGNVVQQLQDTGPGSDANGGRRVTLTGNVLDMPGRPVPGVSVFAVILKTSTVTASAISGPDGAFRLEVPAREHQLGIMSTEWRIVTMVRGRKNAVALTVMPLFVPGEDVDRLLSEPTSGAAGAVAARNAEPGRQSNAVVPSASMGQVTGRVVDEAGTPLGGVRVIAIDPRTRKPVNATATDKDGNYFLIASDGVVEIRPFATGLRLVEVKRPRAGRLDFVLGVTAEAQTLLLTEKTKQHVLRFRMTDSIWPEFVPPPKVRAWMRFSWGIDPMSAMCGQLPYSVCKRRSRLPNYWWLRAVEGTPPNPATRVELE